VSYERRLQAASALEEKRANRLAIILSVVAIALSILSLVVALLK
jgi:hypothetical protein